MLIKNGKKRKDTKKRVKKKERKKRPTEEEEKKIKIRKPDRWSSQEIINFQN